MALKSHVSQETWEKMRRETWCLEGLRTISPGFYEREDPAIEPAARLVTPREIRNRFRNMLPLLYLSAAQARTRARSYREFNVGCALLSFTSLAPEQHAYSMHVGMNVKIEKDARAHCAEPFAIVSAEAAGCTHAIGMVVVGELREEDVGICTTLHPCAQCRLFMQNSPLIRPETLIVTAHPPKDGAPGHHEVRTFKRLVEFHERLTGGRR